MIRTRDPQISSLTLTRLSWNPEIWGFRRRGLREQRRRRREGPRGRVAYSGTPQPEAKPYAL